MSIGEPLGAAREPALRLALRHLPAVDRQRAIDDVLSGRDPAVEILAASRDGALVGALWAQRQPGRTASVCPPQLVDGEPAGSGVLLLSAATERLERRQVVLVQALLETDSGLDFQRFLAAGFHHVCDLLYLVSPAAAFPAEPPAGGLEFSPVSEAELPRLAGVLERTYEGTLDCPQLNGVRATDDVLAGYRAGGPFVPERWLLCRRQGHDVGCLLLADHAAGNQWEVIYMGLLPEARGHGWGLAVVRHAQWLTRSAGRARLVLAVDAGNRPAIAAYAEAGFRAWDRRSVLLRVLTAGSATGGNTARL